MGRPLDLGAWGADMAALCARLGHDFTEPQLLKRAVTHTTFANEHPGQKHLEVLEHIGDAALGLAVAHILVANRRDLDPAGLTRIGIEFKKGSAVADLGERLGIPDCLLVGGSIDLEGVGRAKVVEDATEAVLGALYLDGGFEVVLDLVREHLREAILATESENVVDSKTRLLVFLQRKQREPKAPKPFDSRQLPDGQWLVWVVVDGNELAQATARNKRDAEEEAANLALRRLREAGESS